MIGGLDVVSIGSLAVVMIVTFFTWRLLRKAGRALFSVVWRRFLGDMDVVAVTGWRSCRTTRLEVTGGEQLTISFVGCPWNTPYVVVTLSEYRTTDDMRRTWAAFRERNAPSKLLKTKGLDVGERGNERGTKGKSGGAPWPPSK